MKEEVEKMVKVVKIDDLTPASYNPRLLKDDAQENLMASLRSLGVVKAVVIIGSTGKILAGHQRTRTMKKVGIEECPTFCIENVSMYDEVRFNQLHNFSEVEMSADPPILKVNIPEGTEGFVVVPHKDIVMINKGGEANKVLSLTEMVSKYGQFANVVTDWQGNIIVSAVYAKVMKLLRMPLLAYVLPKGKEEDARHYFSLKYGEYNYDHIERNTYIQSYAQPQRNIDGEEKHNVSTLYEHHVIPRMTKETRVLDFGAGCKAYYSSLKKKGYNIDAIEFFYVGQKMLANNILTEQVERDCKEICRHLEEHGRYDIVLSDHVINSVDSKEAEAAVLRCLSALCKPGGLVCWSGNTFEGADKINDVSKSKMKRSKSAFLDENLFTATARSGVWFFQHYHTLETVCECNEKYIGKSFRVFEQGTERDKTDCFHKSTFDVVAVNECVATKEEMLEALRFEFTLPLPDKKRYELDKYIIPVMEKLL